MRPYKRNEPEVFQMVPLKEIFEKYQINAHQISLNSNLKNGQLSNMVKRPTANVSLTTIDQIYVALRKLGRQVEITDLIRKKK